MINYLRVVAMLNLHYLQVDDVTPRYNRFLPFFFLLASFGRNNRIEESDLRKIITS